MLIIHVFESSGLVFIDLWRPVMSRIDSFCWFLSCLPTFFLLFRLFTSVPKKICCVRSLYFFFLFIICSLLHYTLVCLSSVYTAKQHARTHRNLIRTIFRSFSGFLLLLRLTLSHSQRMIVFKSQFTWIWWSHTKKNTETPNQVEIFFSCATIEIKRPIKTNHNSTRRTKLV